MSTPQKPASALPLGTCALEGGVHAGAHVRNEDCLRWRVAQASHNPSPLCGCEACGAFRRQVGLPAHAEDGLKERIAALERELEVARRDAGTLRAHCDEVARERLAQLKGLLRALDARDDEDALDAAHRVRRERDDLREGVRAVVRQLGSYLHGMEREHVEAVTRMLERHVAGKGGVQ